MRPLSKRIFRIAGVVAAIALLGWGSGVRLFLLYGDSMVPAVNPGDHFVGLVGPWNLRSPARFDRVIFDVPSTSKWAGQEIPWMKRVVGLPGERVKLVGAELLIDGRKVDAPFLYSPPADTTDGALEITLGPDQYFVVGDNLDHSFGDSRTMGPIDRGLIRGFVAAVIRTSGKTNTLSRAPTVSTARVFGSNVAWHLFFYFATAGGAYVVFHVLLKRRLAARQIQDREPPGAAIRRDIFHSLSSAVIFALVGLLTHQMVKQGWTKLYLQIDRHGWSYFWFSLLALIALHDTWFYWTHRLMHSRRLFPIMHRTHHLSHTPTPWSAMAFHPTEAVVQAIVFPIAAMVLPLHPFVALLWLVYMIVINVWGHLGFELLPAGFRRHWLFRWHNTTTHHDMHHRHVTGNYSLYFNFWDRVMGTNHRDY